ncbi:MAG: hypothetical protein M0P50_14610 [Bacteroidales bacterium]|jgi:hypothetical protein|nr:hypothetical protein [Bacteroidales bacterium]
MKVQFRIKAALLLMLYGCLTSPLFTQNSNDLRTEDIPHIILNNDQDIQLVKRLLSTKLDPIHYDVGLYQMVKNNYLLAEKYLGRIKAKIDLLYDLAQIEERNKHQQEQALINLNSYDVHTSYNQRNVKEDQEMLDYFFNKKRFILRKLYELYTSEFNDILYQLKKPRGTQIVAYANNHYHQNDLDRLLYICQDNFNKGYADAGGMTNRQYKLRKLGIKLNEFFFNASSSQVPTSAAGAAINFLHILSETY